VFILNFHLYSHPSEFIDILQCLLLLLKRMGEKFWTGEGPEFPQVVFDSVKDNYSFSQLLQNIGSSTERPWYLSWFREYLHTIRDLPVYGEVLVKIADFLCEETQHERFQDARPAIMASAFSVSLVVPVKIVFLTPPLIFTAIVIRPTKVFD
jgi:senataxin